MGDCALSVLDRIHALAKITSTGVLKINYLATLNVSEVFESVLNGDIKSRGNHSTRHHGKMCWSTDVVGQFLENVRQLSVSAHIWTECPTFISIVCLIYLLFRSV